MKFELGQKVKYRRISKKIAINQKYWEFDDFEEYEEKHLKRRELVWFYKERTGYIVGRRRLTFETIFEAVREEGGFMEPGAEWVKIKRQYYKFAYLVAYDMGKTDYVLEVDLVRVPETYPEVSKIIAAVSIYLARIQLDKETLKVNPLRAEYLKGYRQCRDDVGILARDLIKQKGIIEAITTDPKGTEDKDKYGIFLLDNR